MEVVSLCPLRASSFVWQAQSGVHVLTVIVKATFTLQPGRCFLAPEQAPVNEADRHWDHDAARSVAAPSDKVPYKLRADVMLVGHAYAPGLQPARSVMTRLAVGELDKSIEVWCDRGFLVHNGQLLEGPRFTKMALRWERAAGGPDSANPTGMRFDAPPDAYGVVAVPNLQPPGMFVSRRADTFAPVCFGPIAASWPGRTSRPGRAAGTLQQPGWERRPLPEGLDAAYFQAAPLDQQVAEIRPNERIVLENLHPEHARLVTNLPGVRPMAVVDRASGGRETVALVADTLWIDTDRGVCCVVWRGSIALRTANEEGRIAVTLERELPPEEVDDEDGSQTLPPAARSEGEGDAEEDPETRTLLPILGASQAGPTLPFLRGDMAPPPPSTPLPRAKDGVLPFGRPSPVPAMPAVDPASLVATSASSAPPSVAPPAYVPWPAPVSAPGAAPESAWAAGSPARSSAAPRETIGMTAAAAAAKAGAAPWGAPRQEARLLPLHDEAPLAEPAREFVQLLWYDADSIARMRRVPAWKQVIADLERSPRSREIELVDGAREPWEIEDRQEVLQIMARAPRIDGRGVEEALERAIGEDGKFIPPLVLLGAEIEMPFDELEALKATMSTAAPLVTPADEGLKTAVGVAKDFVQTPGLSAAPAVSEGLTARIRDAFAKEKKALPADYLDTQVERVLLSGRHYQKREVLGGSFLRCLVRLPGESQAIVGYLPEEVGKKLPMWKSFRARLIAEVHPPQDQYETLGRAVKVLGVARAGVAQAKG
ncbi:DUF2169 domain-containing protein [Sorangium sp. So ce118]